jgi:hypothetical protein
VAEFEEGHRVSAILFCSGRCERMNRSGGSVVVSRMASLFICCFKDPEGGTDHLPRNSDVGDS